MPLSARSTSPPTVSPLTMGRVWSIRRRVSPRAPGRTKGAGDPAPFGSGEGGERRAARRRTDRLLVDVRADDVQRHVGGRHLVIDLHDPAGVVVRLDGV